MAELSFRDRFFTPRVARAMTSPLGILLAGAGVALGIVVGLPVVGAAAIGAAAWAGRVAAAVPRRAAGARVDPFALGEPWRRFVQDALQAQRRFNDAVKRARSGPLRERLREIGQRVSTGVEECWNIAQHGQAMTEARSQIDDRETERELAELVRTSPPWGPDSPTQRTVDSLQAQLASVQRMDRVIVDTRDRLRLLDARLDESVARAIELSVQATDVADLRGLGSDVDNLVGEMEALRQGLEEAGGAAQTATG
jgi:hypothetical protein